jgi:hypothetical protein
MSSSGVADKQRRRVIAQPKARRMLDGKLTILVRFVSRDGQMPVERLRDGVGAGKRANGRTAHAHDGSSHRLA